MNRAKELMDLMGLTKIRDNLATDISGKECILVESCANMSIGVCRQTTEAVSYRKDL